MLDYYSTTIQSKNIEFIHRSIIVKALNDKDSITQIAKELGFSRQTIHNEIKRGTIKHIKTDLTIESVENPYAVQYQHEQDSS